jgi:hypothetical protein
MPALSVSVRFAAGAAGRKYLLWRARLLNLYNAKLAIERRGGRDGGGRLYELSTEANDLGTKDCSSARRNLSSRSTFGPFGFA